MQAGITTCRALGKEFVTVQGDLEFYEQFGFTAAGEKGTGVHFSLDDDLFLQPGTTTGLKDGTYVEYPAPWKASEAAD